MHGPSRSYALSFAVVALIHGLRVSASALNANNPALKVHASGKALLLPNAQGGRATLRGSIVNVGSLPMANVEVAIPLLKITTRTNASGEFEIARVPVGVHTVLVRRVGYAQLSESVPLADNEIAVKRFVMLPITILDSVPVNASAVDRRMEDFEARKRTGNGTFLTRDQLATFEDQALARVLPRLAGLRAVRGAGGRTWIASSRYLGGLGFEGRLILSASDKLNGATQQCYSKVYVDNALVYSGNNNEPLFDASTLQVNDIEAIEYYAGAAQTPSQFGGVGASCGVMVIWSRKRR